MAPKIRVSPLGRSSVDLCYWRSEGVLRVTAIAKATFAFIDQGVAQRIPPSPVFGRDRHVDDNPRRSTIEDFQVAPHIPCAGVTLVGSAHPFEASTSMSVRLGVYRGDDVLIEKTLHVFGERTPENPHQSGILGRTPLVYERAAAGPLNLAGSALFSVAHASDPSLPGCFAPLPLAWRARIFGRRALDPATMKASPMEIPPGFDFMFFSSAPADQRVAALHGDEWIILDGLSPRGPRTQTQLPSARGIARFEVEGPRGRDTVPCDLVLDTIGIDSDRGMLSLVFRGHIAIDEQVTRVMVYAGVETLDERLDGIPASPSGVGASASPSGVAASASRSGPPARARSPEPIDLSAQFDEEPERGETVVAKLGDLSGPALPFVPRQTADALPSVVPSTEPELTPMRRRDRRPAPVAATPWDKPRNPPPRPPQAGRPSPYADETVGIARTPSIGETGLPFVPSSALHSTLPSVGQTKHRTSAPPPPPNAARAAPIVEEIELVEESVDEPRTAVAAFVRGLDQTMTSADVTAIDLDPELLRARAAEAAREVKPPEEEPSYAAAPEVVAAPQPVEHAEGAPPWGGSSAPTPTLRDRIEAAARSGESLVDFPLQSADLTAIDLAGRDLAGLDFSGANLSHARLGGAKLDRANLERANLEGADLSHASLQGTVLRGASGPRANLEGARLDEADLRMSKFGGARFSGASLASVQASRADLTGVDLSRSNLSSANFRTARLAESKLVEATVDRADFRDALLTRADLTGVDRSTARFQGANMDGVVG
ncbi:MAG: pentapeptide repeat-containing protein [Polyangiaceae bacterium]